MSEGSSLQVPPCGRRLLALEPLGCWGIHRAPRGETGQEEAEKGEVSHRGPQVWSGQPRPRPEERGRETGHGAGLAHGSFPR